MATIWQFYIDSQPADLAHLVERDLAKVEVAGSSPVIRSSIKRFGSQRLHLMHIIIPEIYGDIAKW